MLSQGSSTSNYVLLHSQSWKQHAAFFLFFFLTCVSISTTCKPMLDTFWFIKCKMAWKEKQSTDLLRQLNFFSYYNLSCRLLAVPDEFLSLLYLLHRVDLVSLQLQQLVDGIFLWGKSAARKVASGCNSALLIVNGGNFFTHSERCRGRRRRHFCSKSQRATWAASKRQRHRTLFGSPIVGENFHLCMGFDSAPADLQTVKWDPFHGDTRVFRLTSAELTSTTTTSTFTFGGKFSSGWKRFTMATSRWMVARRSLLWMTDRRAADNKIKSIEIARMGTTWELHLNAEAEKGQNEWCF